MVSRTSSIAFRKRIITANASFAFPVPSPDYGDKGFSPHPGQIAKPFHLISMVRLRQLGDMLIIFSELQDGSNSLQEKCARFSIGAR